MGDIFMNQKEGKIYHYFEQVLKKNTTLTQTAKFLDYSYRHIKRLWKEYKESGIIGLISKKRGQSSNRRIPDKKRAEIAEIISTNYSDFKPTLVKEKLEERHNIDLSKETVRLIMIEHQIWFPRSRKCNLHQRRDRRNCFGELAQTDASDHLWFEDRGPRCHLYIVIDDATSEIVVGYFEKEETTEGYFKTFELYFKKAGLPMGIYCDKRGTFKINQGSKRNLTQFGRAMKELGIKIIFAHSPQAKGRVERAFETLQDRLVKEMRLENISTIEEGNKFLPQFFEKHKLKFAKAPASSFNAHRPLNDVKSLKYILCCKYRRVVSKNLEINFENEIYQIEANKTTQHLKNVAIDVLVTMEGEIRLEHQGEKIKYRKFCEIPYQALPLQFEAKSTPKKQSKRSHLEIVQQKQKRKGEFSKIVELRGYFESGELLTEEEKRIKQLRVNERRRQSREDNKEVLNDRTVEGGLA